MSEDSLTRALGTVRAIAEEIIERRAAESDLGHLSAGRGSGISFHPTGWTLHRRHDRSEPHRLGTRRGAGFMKLANANHVVMVDDNEGDVVIAELPIFYILTSSGDPRDRERAEQLGASGVLTKRDHFEDYIEFFDSLA